jgi:hypothetical protein
LRRSRTRATPTPPATSPCHIAQPNLERGGDVLPLFVTA